ncbi:undecaprenyldiphospho-muramoylpentapeptide beta-N-acetylglucosaminyltransferase [Leptolyngbya sp. FACHB-36]|uniref:undecaprenyldiphospho-muramoylpentapeptide beta-N-acetylglucosaminyltransferase n=1 Tax=Leptolyngbya sp. FACHB-36 TaxID=2692808 RepID=UPI001680607C|nr:undecaprenyldiphospho-muramoylpentapeptide beta-N-acetylglucosaminyltransferase [Leptolyngbya sp. FACHB-36]MBD2021361.1 undecaprenyldiphospho-muramoylpentapeptide beta-N-acetylglucosaminyltransferase [Leptolyngbya sp. FACHB-36]
MSNRIVGRAERSHRGEPVNDLSDSTLPANFPAAISQSPQRLLIAASGTGGHVFPAIAVAEQLPEYQIEWLGVPDRMETRLVPTHYPRHTISVEGFQQRLGPGTLGVLLKFVRSIWQVRHLLQQGQFQGVFTTGGYIAAPAAIAARSLGLPVVLHESNAIPGKVTRWLSPWCSVVAIGFNAAATHLPRTKTVCVGTPVRAQFFSPPAIDLPIPPDVPLLAIVGGSQGAVAVNKLVRQCAPAWLEAGIWIVHQTGDNDPDAQSLQHPHYLSLPFYDNMAGLLHRANLVVSRAGAGTLTELAIAQTPSILIPFPFAAEDHQTYNAKVFADAGAARLFQQADLTPETITAEVLHLLKDQTALEQMAQQTAQLAVPDSADRLAKLIRQVLLSQADRNESASVR